MAKKLRRAFTIVELVIVIAVIAILAAVLIPTFTSLIDKANQSADTSNVKNMNSILSIDETTNGKPKTMYDAVKVIREGGYDLEKLTPTGQGYDIVWDQDANRLLMVNGDEVIFGETEKNTNDKHLWVVIDSAEKIAATEYSVYLTDAFAGEVTAKQGVDVGSNEDITKVTYNTAEEQNITIRTNGGALVVDAEKATVSHYGAAASVDIQKVANESYHEYGTVEGNVTLAQGRFVAEDNSSAAAVIVTAETYSADNKTVEVVINANAAINSVAAINTNVAALIGEIVENKSTSTEVVDEVIDNEMLNMFSGGVGTENSPYLIANEEQFLKIDDIDILEVYFRVIESFTINEAVEFSKNIIHMDFEDVTLTLDYNAVIDISGNSELNITGKANINWADNLEIGYIFRAEDESKLNIYSGYFLGGLTCVQAGGKAQAKIYGGQFVASAVWNNIYWILNLVDNSDASIEVYGGEFYKFDPANNKVENPPVSFVADGYKSVEKVYQNDMIWYQVIPVE